MDLLRARAMVQQRPCDSPSPPRASTLRAAYRGKPLNTRTGSSAAFAPAAAWTRARPWRGPLLAFAAPLALLMVLQAVKFSPLGTDWLVLVDFALFGLVALATAAIAWQLIAFMVPSRRPRIARRLMLLSLFVAGALAGVQASKPIREHGWREVAVRGDVLVHAIRAFEARNGHPPPTLAALVPAFLPAVPRTGLGSRPEFRYAIRYGDGGRETWSLWARVPGLGHASDFEYLPMAAMVPGDTVLHRVGQWAVVAND
jgi:hypothetical protein